jgi:hypothetical protein
VSISQVCEAFAVQMNMSQIRSMLTECCHRRCALGDLAPTSSVNRPPYKINETREERSLLIRCPTPVRYPAQQSAVCHKARWRDCESMAAAVTLIRSAILLIGKPFHQGRPLFTVAFKILAFNSGTEPAGRILEGPELIAKTNSSALANPPGRPAYPS